MIVRQILLSAALLTLVSQVPGSSGDCSPGAGDPLNRDTYPSCRACLREAGPGCGWCSSADPDNHNLGKLYKIF